MFFELGYSIWMLNMPFFIFVETKGFLCLYQLGKRDTHLSLDQFSNFTNLTQIPGESLSKQGLNPEYSGPRT